MREADVPNSLHAESRALAVMLRASAVEVGSRYGEISTSGSLVVDMLSVTELRSGILAVGRLICRVEASVRVAASFEQCYTEIW